jgi:zinc transporter ZupT
VVIPFVVCVGLELTRVHIPSSCVNDKSDDSTPAQQSLLKVLLAFAVGGLLGDVFLHLLPHAAAGGGEHGHSHSHTHSGDYEEEGHSHDVFTGLWILAGIIGFFVIEKFVRSQHGHGSHGHSHSHSHAHEASSSSASPSAEAQSKARLRKDAQVKSTNQRKAPEDDIVATVDRADIQAGGWLNLAADFSHNFTDGMALGAAFLVSTQVSCMRCIVCVLDRQFRRMCVFVYLCVCVLCVYVCMCITHCTTSHITTNPLTIFFGSILSLSISRTRAALLGRFDYHLCGASARGAT